MAKDYTKTSSRSRPAVRQFKGPGMNLGLKKPRKGYIPVPKDYSKPRSKKSAASTSSYLPDTLGLGGSKSKP